MLISTEHPWGRRFGRAAFLVALTATAPLRAQENDGPQRFDTPEAANAALVQALEAKDIEGLLRILGTRYRDDLLPD